MKVPPIHRREKWPTLSLFVLLGLALHVEGLGAQRVQERSTKAAAVASDFVLGRGRDRPLCPNGMDLASCLQFASGGAAAAKARAISDAATVGGIPIAVDSLLNSIERKRPKVIHLTSSEAQDAYALVAVD